MNAIQNSSTFCGEFCSQGRQQKERLWKVPRIKNLGKRLFRITSSEARRRIKSFGTKS